MTMDSGADSRVEMPMRRFLIVVEKAGSNFSAYSPDLPGCIATGATPEETKARMQAAIDMHVQGLREDHLPIPEPSAIAEYVEVAP
jgi:predicted RNase H-like HicB family nuclease